MATTTTIQAESMPITLRKGQAIVVGGITLFRAGADEFRLTKPVGVQHRIATPEKPVVQSAARPAETPATDEQGRDPQRSPTAERT